MITPTTQPNACATTDLALPELAARINEAHRECESAARSAIDHAVKAGDFLIQAKTQCGHGEWFPWLRDHVEVSHRTAQVYMRLASDLPKLDDSNAQRAALLSLRGVAKMLGASKNIDTWPDVDGETHIVSDIQELIDAGKRFGTVYADPPWRYGNQGTRAATDNHYPTMTVEEICELKVTEVLNEQAHLHLWTTNAFLFDAKRVIEAWGFEYRSLYVWIKPQMGLGNYWRVSHELLLLGVRGGLTFRNKGEMSWGEFKRYKHSAKPEAIRNKIEGVSPGEYLELFGRNEIPGWTVLGNQVERNLLCTGSNR